MSWKRDINKIERLSDGNGGNSGNSGGRYSGNSGGNSGNSGGGNSSRYSSGNKKRLPLIDFNSPVILSLFFFSLLLVIVSTVSGGIVIRFLGCYFTRWSDPFMYFRMFTHVLAHQDMAHFASNYLLLLVVGPMLEEKYGSRRLVWMLVITAGITGLINIIFFRNIALIGASGLVFMAILLASFTNIKSGRLPVTVLLVGILYIGNEIVRGIFSADNISQLSHIIGGICGAIFGFEAHVLKTRKQTGGGRL